MMLAQICTGQVSKSPFEPSSAPTPPQEPIAQEPPLHTHREWILCLNIIRCSLFSFISAPYKSWLPSVSGSFHSGAALLSPTLF